MRNPGLKPLVAEPVEIGADHVRQSVGALVVRDQTAVVAYVVVPQQIGPAGLVEVLHQLLVLFPLLLLLFLFLPLFFLLLFLGELSLVSGPGFPSPETLFVHRQSRPRYRAGGEAQRGEQNRTASELHIPIPKRLLCLLKYE